MVQEGLFRKKEMPPPDNTEVLLEVIRRGRTLEERYSNLERRTQVTEENMIVHHRKLSSEIRLLNDDLGNVKKLIADLNDKLQLFVAELQHLAKREDVEVLKKYLNYWQPIKFVTSTQVEKIVNEVLDERSER